MGFTAHHILKQDPPSQEKHNRKQEAAQTYQQNQLGRTERQRVMRFFQQSKARKVLGHYRIKSLAKSFILHRTSHAPMKVVDQEHIRFCLFYNVPLIVPSPSLLRRRIRELFLKKAFNLAWLKSCCERCVGSEVHTNFSSKGDFKPGKFRRRQVDEDGVTSMERSTISSLWKSVWRAQTGLRKMRRRHRDRTAGGFEQVEGRSPTLDRFPGIHVLDMRDRDGLVVEMQEPAGGARGGWTHRGRHDGGRGDQVKCGGKGALDPARLQDGTCADSRLRQAGCRASGCPVAGGGQAAEEQGGRDGPGREVQGVGRLGMVPPR